MNSKNIKPCPFCGQEITILDHGEPFYAIYCGNCDLEIERAKGEDELIEFWNHRSVGNLQTFELVEIIRKLCDSPMPSEVQEIEAKMGWRK